MSLWLWKEVQGVPRGVGLVPVSLSPPDRTSLFPVAGVSLCAVSAGIRKAGRTDLLLIGLAPGTTVAGVFTQNAFCAAPVQVCRMHLASAQAIRALVINTGCANAGTGRQGLADAHKTCQRVAEAGNFLPSQVLPFSTGVILENLPMDRMESGLREAFSKPDSSDWFEAAQAIMTTDTQPKAVSRRVMLAGGAVVITGISKGAGMIRPNMATMLGFMATDAAIGEACLAGLTREAADRSFNAITIDGDTSTNDSYVAMATGQSGVALSSTDASVASDWVRFKQAWFDVSEALAQAIIRDGEGATKFMTIRVSSATTMAEARQVAYAVAHSPLVKTAFFASDPNLGRILAAIGYSGVSCLDAGLVSVRINGTLVAEGGQRAASYTEAQGQAAMAPDEIEVDIDLGRGSTQATVWTCDLSHDYISINADYRS